MTTADFWINQLGLQPHPEGGYYKETYRAQGIIPETGLPPHFQGPRHWSTAIYFLLQNNDCSHLHRLQADELWHFHKGNTLAVHVFNPAKQYASFRLGGNAEAGDTFQLVIPAGSWFGAHLVEPDGFALIGCTVSPGFDFKDFELGRREELLKTFPDHADVVTKLTK